MHIDGVCAPTKRAAAAAPEAPSNTPLDVSIGHCVGYVSLRISVTHSVSAILKKIRNCRRQEMQSAMSGQDFRYQISQF